MEILALDVYNPLMSIVSTFDYSKPEEDNIRALRNFYKNGPHDWPPDLIFSKDFGVIVFRFSGHLLEKIKTYCESAVEKFNQLGYVVWDGATAEFIAKDKNEIELPPWNKTIKTLEEWISHIHPGFKVEGFWNRSSSYVCQKREEYGLGASNSFEEDLLEVAEATEDVAKKEVIYKIVKQLRYHTNPRISILLEKISWIQLHCWCRSCIDEVAITDERQIELAEELSKKVSPSGCAASLWGHVKLFGPMKGEGERLPVIQFDMNGIKIAGKVISRSKQNIMVRAVSPYGGMERGASDLSACEGETDFRGENGDREAKRLLKEIYELNKFIDDNLDELKVKAKELPEYDQHVQPKPFHYSRRRKLKELRSGVIDNNAYLQWLTEEKRKFAERKQEVERSQREFLCKNFPMAIHYENFDEIVSIVRWRKDKL